MVLAVVGAAEVLVDAEVAADLGEVVLGGAAAVAVGDVGGLFEGEALAIVGCNVHKESEVVEVVLVGNLVGVVAEAVEVVEVNVTDGVGARQGAGIFARPSDDDGGDAWAVVVGVTECVVRVEGEGGLGMVGVGVDHGRLGPDGTALVDIGRLDAADGGVALGHLRVDGIAEVDVAEGLSRRDGDGDGAVVAAGRVGATRHAGAVQFLDLGVEEPKVGGIEFNRDRAARGNVGEVVGLGEVERACDSDIAPLEADVLAVEGVAATLCPWLGIISQEALGFPYMIVLAVHEGAISREGHGTGDGGESLLPREDGYYGEQRGEDFLDR